ncbi:MAG: hypothetical protein ACLPYZ_12920 [Limisphaerales bacterium]
MIKLPKSRNPPCAPATIRETMAGRCATAQPDGHGHEKPEGRQPSMAQGPWLKDGLLALLLLPVPE